MNTHDGKHIFISFWKPVRVWGAGVVVKGANVTSCLFPSKPSGSEGQTDDIHKERERLRLVLKQMGRIKCPSEVCIPSFSLCLSLILSYSLLCFVIHIHFSKFANTVLFPLSSFANLRFFFCFLLSQSCFPWGLLLTSWAEPHEHSALLTLQCKKRKILKCSHTEKLRICSFFFLSFLIKVNSCYIPITPHQRKVI